MGTHVWSGGPSRRGRRMSLEFALGRPMGTDSEYLHRHHPGFFHPYQVPGSYLNGIHHKVGKSQVEKCIDISDKIPFN